MRRAPRLRAPLQEPRVLVQVAQRPDHALPDAQRRLPAQCADPGAVEKDERAIADPSSLPPRVNAFGGHAQILADPGDGIVHLAVLVGAEVEDVDLLASRLDCQEHRIDAVLDVQIGLPLLPVTEHGEAVLLRVYLYVEV